MDLCAFLSLCMRVCVFVCVRERGRLREGDCGVFVFSHAQFSCRFLCASRLNFTKSLETICLQIRVKYYIFVKIKTLCMIIMDIVGKYNAEVMSRYQKC